MIREIVAIQVPQAGEAVPVVGSSGRQGPASGGFRGRWTGSPTRTSARISVRGAENSGSPCGIDPISRISLVTKVLDPGPEDPWEPARCPGKIGSETGSGRIDAAETSSPLPT